MKNDNKKIKSKEIKTAQKKQNTSTKKIQSKDINARVVVNQNKSMIEKNQETNIEQIEKKETIQTLNFEKVENNKDEKIIKPQIEEFTYKKEKNKKRVNIIIIIIVILLIGTIITGLMLKAANERKKVEIKNNQLAENIGKHYNNYVVTNKETVLYTYTDKKYQEVGTIAKEVELSLKEEKIDYHTIYFKITNLPNEYYISYEDVTPIDEISIKSDRYKKYIPYNKNIITKDKIKLYNSKNELIYSLPEKLNTPIIINDDNFYGIEYNDELLFIKNEDIEKIEENKNTNKNNTKSIAVLNYHFFYDENDPKEVTDCNQEICHSKTLFKSHLNYIKENNIFTPTMEEYELYMNKKINLPKSVLITIDDGWRMGIGIDLLEEYKLNGTVFLITSWWENDIDFINNFEYVKFHSHGDNLHNPGVCPGGQGGAIKCLTKSKLLDDLALSRKKLNGSHIFCYPFYEYNDYSIEVLKEAGFTMAFAGNNRRSVPEDNKYAIPRYVMTNTTTVYELKSYIG